MATPAARPIRVHDETWQRAKARAAREGTTVSAEINGFLERYAGVPSERRATPATTPARRSETPR